MLAYNSFQTEAILPPPFPSQMQYDCTDFAPNNWGPTPPTVWTIRHNIGYGSDTKINFDKHFRKYVENKNAFTTTTAVLHLRNITKGLTVHDNNFDKIYSVAGGTIYVEGFNNTFSKSSSAFFI